MTEPKYIDGTLIVNKTYPLPADFDPGDLTAETKAALAEMCGCAGRDGLSYKIISGYRSYKTQETTYAYYLGLLGREKADACSARPGFSEHQTGLAFDLNDNTEAFGDTPTEPKKSPSRRNGSAGEKHRNIPPKKIGGIFLLVAGVRCHAAVHAGRHKGRWRKVFRLLRATAVFGASAARFRRRRRRSARATDIPKKPYGGSYRHCRKKNRRK